VFDAGDTWNFDMHIERSAVDRDLTTGTWRYQVDPIDAAGNRNSSGSVKSAVVTTIPVPPSSLQASDAGSGKVAISWVYPSDQESKIDGYILSSNWADSDRWPITAYPHSRHPEFSGVSAIVATPSSRSWASGTLTAGIWRFTVNAYKGSQISESLFYVEFELAGSPLAIVRRPTSPLAITASPAPGGDVNVIVTVDASDCDLVNVYHNAGSGSVDYATLRGSIIVPEDSGFIRKTVLVPLSAGLTDGVETIFGSRASLGGTEDDNTDTATTTPDATAPLDPTVTATASFE
jgi:hypothetical protein